MAPVWKIKVGRLLSFLGPGNFSEKKLAVKLQVGKLLEIDFVQIFWPQTFNLNLFYSLVSWMQTSYSRDLVLVRFAN